MQSHVSECWSRDIRIANWYENCKLIWKLQTHMKIANVHIGTIHQNVRIANWYENCKLIWELQSNSHVLVCSSYVDVCIFHMRHSGNENFSGTERMFQFDCGVDDKNSTKQSLAKPSTIHVLILIPMMTQYDSYFKSWFLCSLQLSSCESRGIGIKIWCVRCCDRFCSTVDILRHMVVRKWALA